MQYSQEHLKTMVYAEFGGQTERIMGNWKIENSHSLLSIWLFPQNSLHWFFSPLFTYTGRQFNKYGEISDPWWSNFTLTGFNDKSQCLVDQYSQYPLDIDGLQMFVCIKFFV